jgi:Rha family phage regulatory protein
MTTALSAFTPVLEVINSHVYATSGQVAEHFNKQHYNVLRAIKNLECSPGFHALNFEGIQNDVDLGLGRVRKDPAYRMTRDGFTFLAMGFTGRNAAQWKESYITTFNKMEAALIAGSITISPAQAQELRELVQLVAESGVQGHGETWNRLHRKFHVNSYLQLPGGMFTAAVAYLKGKMDGQSLKALAVKHFPELAARDTIDAGREALASAYVGFTKLETAIFAAKEQIMLDLMGMNDLMLDARLSIR